MCTLGAFSLLWGTWGGPGGAGFPPDSSAVCPSRPLAVTEVLGSRHLPPALRPPGRTGLPPNPRLRRGASLGHFWIPPQEICLSLTASSLFQLHWGSSAPQAALHSPEHEGPRQGHPLLQDLSFLLLLPRPEPQV